MLFIKENTADILQDGFQRPAPCISHDRSAAGLHFHRDQAEILFAGENEALTASIQFQDMTIALPPQKFYIRGSHGAKFFIFGSCADYFEGPSGLCIGLHGQVNPFIRDQGRNNQVKGFGGLSAGSKRLHINGRVNNIRQPTVASVDPTLDMFTDGHEAGHPGRYPMIPFPQAFKHGAKDHPFNGVTSKILIIEDPCITHRRKAVTKMMCVGSGPDAFGDTMTGADGQIRLRGCKAFHGGRKERKKIPVVMHYTGYVLQPGGFYGMAVDVVGYATGLVYQGIHRRFRPGPAQQFQHPFASAHTGQPVMRKDNIQIFPVIRESGHRAAICRFMPDLQLKKAHRWHWHCLITDMIAITGMHRSGTSCVTELLKESGFSLGTRHRILDEPGRHNARGHFENAGALMLNQLVLHEAGGNWIHVPPAAKILEAGEKLQGYFHGFEKAFDGDIFKDPRTTVTFPLWEKYCASLEHVVFCFRHPLAVAQSLNRRHNLPAHVGLSIWFVYHARFFKGVSNIPVTIVDYDHLCSAPEEVLECLLQALDQPIMWLEVQRVVQDSFESRLNHAPFTDAMLQRLPPQISAMYQVIRERSCSARLAVLPA